MGIVRVAMNSSSSSSSFYNNHRYLDHARSQHHIRIGRVILCTRKGPVQVKTGAGICGIDGGIEASTCVLATACCITRPTHPTSSCKIDEIDQGQNPCAMRCWPCKRALYGLPMVLPGPSGFGAGAHAHKT